MILLRIIIGFIDRKTKGKDMGKVATMALKCCQCCLWCLHKTLKYITRWCYIYIALQV